MEEKSNNESTLGKKATYKGLVLFALPSIFMMIAVSIYSVVDGFFVSRFAGPTPFASVNLVYPVIMLIAAIGFMMGSGGAALVAKKFGEGKTEEGNRCFFLAVFAATVLGLITSALVFIFMKEICLGLHADEEMLPLCVTYGRILAAGVVFFNLQNLFQSFFMVAEKPNLGFLVTFLAGITNIVLDAVLIVGFDLGVIGAGIGTIAGQGVAALLSIIYFARPNSSPLLLRFHRVEIKPILKMMGNGSSEFVTNAAVSVLSIFINLKLYEFYGENGISAYGVISYLWLIFAALFIGFNMSVSPKISYQYGAKNTAELSSLLRKSLVLLLVFGFVATAMAEALAYPICYAYVGYDKELFSLCRHAFVLYGFTYLFMGVSMFGSAYFTALNNGALSCFISLLRLAVIELGLLQLLPIFLAGEGVWISMILAQPVEAIFVLALILANGKRYGYHLFGKGERQDTTKSDFR